MTGIPKQISVSYSEIARSLDKSIMKIEAAVSAGIGTYPAGTCRQTYLQSGLWLTGGGALLRGLDKSDFPRKPSSTVRVAEDPLRAVVRGTGIALKNIGKFKFLMNA
jgi:rod shape-determining protein MreB and related proteins